MTFKTNRPSTQETKDLTRALRHHINKDNLDAFLESIESKSVFEIKDIHKLVYIPFIEKRINDDKELSRKEKKEKIKLFKDFESKFKPLENDALDKYRSEESLRELRRQLSKLRRLDWRRR